MNEAPKIVPGNAAVMGESIAVIADATPSHFPAGFEIVLMVPGQVKPLGSAVVPSGCMLAIVPPSMAKAMRAQIRKQMQDHAGPGQVKAPGLH